MSSQSPSLYIENKDENLIINEISLDSLNTGESKINFKFQLPINSTTISKPQSTTNNRKKLIILAINKSKSIENIWPNIQLVVLNFLKIIKYLKKQENKHNLEIILEVLLFSDTCIKLDNNNNNCNNNDNDNLNELILNEKPIGKTNLASLFFLINDIIKNYYKFSDEKNIPIENNIDTTIILISDGNHSTIDNHKEAFKQLCYSIVLIKTTSTSSIIFNTISFTLCNNKINDLKGITNKINIINNNNNGIFLFFDSNLNFSFDESIIKKLKEIIKNSNFLTNHDRLKYLSIGIPEVYIMTGGGPDNGGEILFLDNENCNYLPDYPVLQDENGNLEISIPIKITGYYFTHVYINLNIDNYNATIILTPHKK